MATGISNIINSQLRLSGLSSGLDTDSIIQQLMRIEQAKVDKAKQDKQLLEWKRNDYREMTSLLRAFKDEYFDILKPLTNFKSGTAFASFTVSSTDLAIAAAKAGTGASSGSHSLTVKQLATATKIESGSAITSAVNGSLDITDFSLEGKQIGITLDGITKTINLENYTLRSDLGTKLGIAVSNAFGAGKFDILTSGNKIEIKSLIAGSTFSISDASVLGFDATDNTSNRISLGSKLASIGSFFAAAVDFDSESNVEFTINGETINLNKTFADATISDVISAVNTSKAGVEMKYDYLNDKFSLTSKTTGMADDITFTDTDPVNGLLKALGIDGGIKTAGQDSVFDLDGVENMQRSGNNFTIEGVSYSLTKADPAKTVIIEVNQDVDSLVNKIKGFVDKYNDLIGKLNSKAVEKREKGYLPLTDEQKEAMKEKDITAWEEKAKSGMLYGDSIISSIANDMRKALTDSISGISSSLYKIGITTGSYETKGQLLIDEGKLRKAIEDDVDSVARLFTQESQYTYEEALSDPDKKTIRYQESGLAQRLYDIIQNNIRTARDNNGKKGILLEKAGIKGDLTEFNNYMNKAIKDKDTLIDNLISKLITKENSLYIKFTAMEKALGQLNSQSAWLSQQFSGNMQ